MTEVKKISLNLLPEVTEELEKRVGQDGSQTMEINSILKNWYAMMRNSKRRMRSLFNAEEKGLLLDATNGYYMGDLQSCILVYATVEDSIETYNLDAKWGVGDPGELISKLRNLTPMENLALAEAIREWWLNDSTSYDDLLAVDDTGLRPNTIQ